jgi:hypothetical protein
MIARLLDGISARQVLSFLDRRHRSECSQIQSMPTERDVIRIGDLLENFRVSCTQANRWRNKGIETSFVPCGDTAGTGGFPQ